MIFASFVQNDAVDDKSILFRWGSSPPVTVQKKCGGWPVGNIIGPNGKNRRPIGGLAHARYTIY